MRLFKIITPVFAAAISLAVSAQAWAEDVGVFAAASATNALNDIAELYAAKSKTKIVPSYAASSALAKQIENGAPANVFLSADEKWMDYLGERKLIVADSRINLLGNRLVLVAPADSTISLNIAPGFALAKALGEGRLAVGDPAHVPIGLYAKSALEKLGVWSEVEGKIAAADSVRTALAFVERGETPLGIVYATDAALSKKVKVVATFPEDSHPPVVYPAAIVAGKDTAEARDYFAFLKSDEAKAVFKKYGFAVE